MDWYYKVLLQYYKVLLRTTKYYASTTKYYSVLQSSTLYYKLLRQYYSVLQSTTPVLQSTTPSSASATKSDTWASPNIAPVKQNDSHAWSWSHMKRHLQCAEQQVSPSNLTKYRACHTEWLACLIVVTYETSFTMRGATSVTIKPHQILRLSDKKTHIRNPHHTWNLISNAQSNRCHHQTSPNTAPVTQKDSHSESSSHMKPHLQCAEELVSPSNLTKYCACHTKRLTFWVLITYETSFPMRGATGVTIQPHQILRLPRKMTLQDLKKISKNRWNVISNAGTIRAWSEHDPTMIREWKRKPQPASPPRLLFELTTSIFYWKIQRFAPNLTFKPSPNTAPATKSNTSTSRSTAPATKNDTERFKENLQK